MSTEQEILSEIATELDEIEFGNNKSLASLLRKTEVYIKKIFGIESEYYERYCNLSFVPEGVIYNTGHYKNQEKWDIGISNYKSLLETLSYEFELRHISSTSALNYPNQVTWQWLKTHVPVKIWISFVSLLITSFLIGVAANEYGITKLFNSNASIETQQAEGKKPNKTLQGTSGQRDFPEIILLPKLWVNQNSLL